jgi:hypothetical protein
LAGSAQVAEAQWALGGQVNLGAPVPFGVLDDAAGPSFAWGFGLRMAPPTGNVALRLDIENARFNIDNAALLENDAWSADAGSGRIWDFQLNAEFGMKNDAPFRIYGIAGIGYGQLYANVTEGVLVGGCYWDPWWGYICGSGVANEILAEASRWAFSSRVGAGMSYKVGYSGPAVFVEARYGMLFTGGESAPEPSPYSGRETQSAKWMPISIGLRF